MGYILGLVGYMFVVCSYFCSVSYFGIGIVFRNIFIVLIYLVWGYKRIGLECLLCVLVGLVMKYVGSREEIRFEMYKGRS